MVQVFSHNELSLVSSVMSIGAFDGVHRGHQSLIKKVVNRAQATGAPSLVYTFNPPPRVHFKNSKELIGLNTKIQLMEQLGVDYLVIADFNDVYASKPASAFIKELASLGPKEIWVGENFQFGKDKTGTVKMISRYFNVNTCPLVTCDKGDPISSTRIRNLLSKNELHQAHALLGRDCQKAVVK